MDNTKSQSKDSGKSKRSWKESGWKKYIFLSIILTFVLLGLISTLQNLAPLCLTVETEPSPKVCIHRILDLDVFVVEFKNGDYYSMFVSFYRIDQFFKEVNQRLIQNCRALKGHIYGINLNITAKE